MAFPVALQQFGGCLNSKNYSCLFAVFFHKFPDVDLYFKPYKKKNNTERWAPTAPALPPLTCRPALPARRRFLF